MMNQELISLAEQEEGILTDLCYFTDTDSEKLSTIFNAWVEGKTFHIHRAGGADNWDKSRAFLSASREHDNHKWLINSLMK